MLNDMYSRQMAAAVSLILMNKTLLQVVIVISLDVSLEIEMELEDLLVEHV